MSCENAIDRTARAIEAWKAEEKSWHEQMARLRADLEKARRHSEALVLLGARLQSRIAELESSESALKGMVERQALNGHAQREALSKAQGELRQVDADLARVRGNSLALAREREKGASDGG